MRKWSKYIKGFTAISALIILIIDAKTATQGIHEGIQLCLQTVIPSLFPFLVFTPIICRQFSGDSLRFMTGIKRLCKLPDGAEAILLFGLLGGYPTGAALISTAYKNQQLSKTDAERMLGFCSNAGPAFVFGLIGSLFSNPLIPWLLWLIHILSAIFVGYCTRRDPTASCSIQTKSKISITKQIEQSVRTMSIICAWVILFRMLSLFLTNWILKLFPPEWQIVIIGALELSNGCLLLRNCISNGASFIICACLLAFGGFCVLLQTKSVCGCLGIGNYFPGKLLQSSISLLLACLIVPFICKIRVQSVILASCFAVITSAVSFCLIRGRKKLWKIRST